MAKYKGVSGSRNGLKIIFVILIIVILVISGIVWFDFLGIIDMKKTKKIVSAKESGLDLTGIELLDSERLVKTWESLEKWESELTAKSDELVFKDRDISEQLDNLAENKKALEEEQKNFEESKTDFKTKEDKIYNITTDFLNMPPDIAVKSLEKMSDQDIIEILKSADKIAEERNQGSMSSVWLSKMEPEKVAVINRKRLVKDLD